MALIAEEVVQEWLNQQKFFTIRGIKLGVNEMDILALRQANDVVERRHYEVQASINPVSYISAVPKKVQRSSGRRPGSAKVRTAMELEVGVNEWIYKKFLDPKKDDLRQQLSPGDWSFHFVVNNVRHQEELDVFQRQPVEIVHLKDVLSQLKTGGLFTASRKDLVDLMLMDRG